MFKPIAAVLAVACMAGCTASAAGTVTPGAPGASPAAGAAVGANVAAPAIGEELTSATVRAKYAAFFAPYAVTYKKGTKWTTSSTADGLPAGTPAPAATEITREVVELTATTAKIKMTVKNANGSADSELVEKLPTAADPLPDNEGEDPNRKMKYLGQEKVTVPAGTYDCAKFESPGPTGTTGASTIWWAKGVGVVKMTSPAVNTGDAGTVTFTSTTVLTAYVAGN